LILDTDIGTDVDDAFALAFALRHPLVDLVAVTTVSGDVRRRGHIARKLLGLAGRPDVEVAAGRTVPPRAGTRAAWMGHEGEGLLEPGEQPELSRRDGVSLLLEETAEAVRAERAIHVAAIGAQTNVAAALDRDARFSERVAKMAVMGGVFGPRADGTRVPPSRDHNLNVDQHNAVRSLNAHLPLLYVPCNVTLDAIVTRRHLELLRSGDALCQSLAWLTDRWAEVLRRKGDLRVPDQVATLHDPLTVACLVDRRFVTVEELPITVAIHDGMVRTFIDPVNGTSAEVVTSVDADGFVDACIDTISGA
ncbi:MAG: nucleoside hydrolase, partial [Actinomycetota bacterium]|nr:nucleoside hydrolase [Actinomycetota bacterium]